MTPSLQFGSDRLEVDPTVEQEHPTVVEEVSCFFHYPLIGLPPSGARQLFRFFHHFRTNSRSSRSKELS